MITITLTNVCAVLSVHMGQLQRGCTYFFLFVYSNPSMWLMMTQAHCCFVWMCPIFPRYEKIYLQPFHHGGRPLGALGPIFSRHIWGIIACCPVWWASRRRRLLLLLCCLSRVSLAVSNQSLQWTPMDLLALSPRPDDVLEIRNRTPELSRSLVCGVLVFDLRGWGGGGWGPGVWHCPNKQMARCVYMLYMTLREGIDAGLMDTRDWTRQCSGTVVMLTI